MNRAQRSAARGHFMSAAAPVPEAQTQFHLPSYLLGLVTALVLLGAAVFFLRRPEPAVTQTAAPATSAFPPAFAAADEYAGPTNAKPACHICQRGSSASRPLHAACRGRGIGDAIAAAGGLLSQVDPAFVNQAQPLTDGAQLHIPTAQAGVDPAAGASMPGPQAAASSQDGVQPADPQAVPTELASRAPRGSHHRPAYAYGNRTCRCTGY